MAKSSGGSSSKPEVTRHYTTPPYGTVVGDESKVTVTDDKGRSGTGNSEKQARENYEKNKR